MSKLKTNEIAPYSTAGIGIGAPNIQPGAMLNIESTNQGVALPRMTTVQRNSIPSPFNGLVIYNTDNNNFEVHDGTSWTRVSGIQSVNGQDATDQILNVGSTGTAPNITQSGSNINTINIPNASTSGVTSGLLSNSEYTSFNSRLFAIQNVKYVVKNSILTPNHFNEIQPAIDSITDASASNPYTVKVGPGVYTGTITLKPYVWLEGSEQDQTVIVATAGDHTVYGSDFSGISMCILRGANASNKAAVYHASLTGTTNTAFMVEDCRFGDNDHLVIADASSAPTAVFIENCKLGGVYQFNNGFLAINGGRVNIRNTTTTALTAPYPNFVIKASGTDSEIITNGFQIRSGGLTTGAGIHLVNGAKYRGLSCNINGFGKALYIEDSGAASVIDAVGILCENNTIDLQIDHPGSDGTFNGSADHTKIIINPSSSFSVVMSCNKLPTDGTGSVIVGDMLQGDRYDRLANLSKLARETATVGVISGGVLSNPSGLNIDVTAGTGFLIDPTDLFVKEVSWSSGSLSIPVNSVRYIFIDTNGVIQASASEPSLITTILLGRVSSTATTIRFIEAVEMDMVHLSNKLEHYLRDLGPVFTTGGIVSEQGNRQLNVTAGEYHYGVNELTLSGGTAINYTAIYRDGSGGWIESSQNTVSNTQYDDGTGTLASIPAGQFAKHILYCLGNAGNEKYFLIYAQSTQTTLATAEAEPLPLVPTYITDAVSRLATLIVQQGVTNFVKIQDIRPRIGFAAPSSAGTTDHGNLLGLSDDDHPQYLLINGTRSMSGNLDMGGQSITNVNLVDGIDVTTHASRHLPLGSDPITTAAPLIAVGGSTTNQVGTANSLSRSDHQHDVATGAASTQVPDQSNAEGSSNDLARADHIHNIPTAAPSGTIGATTVNGQGVAATFSRADHQHQIATGTPSTQTPDQANATGTSNNLARADHTHAIPTASAISISTSTSNAQGSASTFARADHTHAVSVSNTEVKSSVAFITASLTDVVITSFTTTPGAGTYLVLVNAQGTFDSNARRSTISIYTNGVQVTDTERTRDHYDQGRTQPMLTSCIVTVTAGQAIDARVRVSGGTLTVNNRSLILIKLA